jgi:hypothetical protein
VILILLLVTDAVKYSNFNESTRSTGPLCSLCRGFHRPPHRFKKKNRLVSACGETSQHPRHQFLVHSNLTNQNYTLPPKTPTPFFFSHDEPVPVPHARDQTTKPHRTRATRVHRRLATRNHHPRPAGPQAGGPRAAGAPHMGCLGPSRPPPNRPVQRQEGINLSLSPSRGGLLPRARAPPCRPGPRQRPPAHLLSPPPPLPRCRCRPPPPRDTRVRATI